jgi:hypothetical protein
MILLVCPQDIADVCRDAAVPFGPALAGLPAAGQCWRANWTCGALLAFGNSSFSSFLPDNAPLLDADAKASPAAFENVLLQHLCPPVQGPDAPVCIGSIAERYAAPLPPHDLFGGPAFCAQPVTPA